MKSKNSFKFRFSLIFVIILAILILFYLPVFWAIECITVPCNSIKDFIFIFDLNNSRVVSINYLYLVLEILASIIIAFSIAKLIDLRKN